jgi:hypothetical protein
MMTLSPIVRFMGDILALVGLVWLALLLSFAAFRFRARRDRSPQTFASCMADVLGLPKER